MRNIAQALNVYELQKRQYPGYLNVLKLNNGRIYSDPATGQPRGVSYIVPLLSYLDKPELERVWKDPAATETRRRGKDGQGYLPSLSTCPSGPNGRSDHKEPCPLSYVVNCGMPDISVASAMNRGMPRDWAANGVFFDLFTDNAEVMGKPPQPAGQSDDDFGIYSGARSGIPLVACPLTTSPARMASAIHVYSRKTSMPAGIPMRPRPRLGSCGTAAAQSI
jgi:hypothetical protein